MDFNNAKKHTPPSSLIPKNTIVPVHMTLRPGGAGDGGWLKRNKDGTCMMLDAEFTVIDDDYARRKFWSMLVVEGETDGQKQAADITGSLVRSMLEAVSGINPSDESEAAIKARQITGWGDLDGLRFQAVVGVRKGTDGYEDKNSLSAIVTPDRKDYVRLEQVGGSKPAPKAATTAAKPAVSASRPSWAA